MLNFLCCDDDVGRISPPPTLLAGGANTGLNRDDPATQDRGQPLALDVAVEKLRKLRDDRGTYNPFPAPAKAEKATA